MKHLQTAVLVIAMALNGAAGLYGAWCWWRVRSSVWFWRLLRAGQVAVILEVLLVGARALGGPKPSGLHVLYAVLPVLVSLIAEQLRIGSAYMVLDQKGLESASAVGELPEEEQHVIALSILQREVGVMALAALVNVALLARAAGTA